MGRLSTAEITAFAERLSQAVGGGPVGPQAKYPGDAVFKNASGYDCGVSPNPAGNDQGTAHVFVYALTPKTLHLPDLSDASLEKAAGFVRADGRPDSGVRAASATYSEVEEALKGFLERNPDVAKDASIARGPGLDDVLKGAVATMAFEGVGSLFDTMNYGTGNPERDKQVLNDLQKTLADIGMYYEMGHDWSLGVYPLEESAEEAAARTAVDALAAHTKDDPETFEVQSTFDTPAGPVLLISRGNQTFYVGDDSALHELAVQQMRDTIASDPTFLSIETQLGWVDRSAIREQAEAIAQELASADAEEIDQKEKRAWVEEQSGDDPNLVVQEGEIELTDQQVDAYWDAHMDEWITERAEASIGSDPYDYVIEMAGGEEEFAKSAQANGLIDTERMAEDIVSQDGYGASLGGEEGTLPGGLAYVEA